jgi:hypothetical protein
MPLLQIRRQPRRIPSLGAIHNSLLKIAADKFVKQKCGTEILSRRIVFQLCLSRRIAVGDFN